MTVSPIRLSASYAISNEYQSAMSETDWPATMVKSQIQQSLGKQLMEHVDIHDFESREFRQTIYKAEIMIYPKREWIADRTLSKREILSDLEEICLSDIKVSEYDLKEQIIKIMAKINRANVLGE